MKNIFKKRAVRAGLLILVLTGGLALAYRPDDHYFAIAKNLEIFAAVFRDLDAYYVDSIKPDALITTGIEAMTESLDPYTYFYAEDDLDELKFQTTGKYGGVGAAIRKENGWPMISDIYENSPMQKAGVKVGDRILSLDGESAKDMTVDDVSAFLKGQPGTSLSIVFQNPVTGRKTTRQITRAEIDIHSIPYSGMTDNGIGYIKLSQFTEMCSAEAAEAFQELRKDHSGMKGLILDLRGNPGGLLTEAVKTANLFIGEGQTVVQTKGKIRSWNRTYSTTRAPLDDSIRLVVLTDRRTASAAEIVAGAVQDLDRGLIVGQRSFGKGLVQSTRSLPYHTKIKITIAKYYTPSGRCIQAIDYSHRHEDGSVMYVPDSLKRAFKTKGGRTVMDGGGIEPDVEITPEYLHNITLTLLSRNYIFDYATHYYYAHPKPPGTDFRLSNEGFDDFVQYLDGKDYDYKTRSEAALDRFRRAAEQEQYFDAVSREYQALKSKMKHDKRGDLFRHRDEIMRLLEEEIAGRYYLEAGRIRQSLPYDPDVQKAIQLIKDTTEYNALLNGKLKVEN